MGYRWGFETLGCSPADILQLMGVMRERLFYYCPPGPANTADLPQVLGEGSCLAWVPFPYLTDPELVVPSDQEEKFGQTDDASQVLPQ